MECCGRLFVARESLRAGTSMFHSVSSVSACWLTLKLWVSLLMKFTQLSIEFNFFYMNTHYCIGRQRPVLLYFPSQSNEASG